MNLKGFEAINQALAAANIEAQITPQPLESEDLRYVTIETDAVIQPAHVLHALGASGLMDTRLPVGTVRPYGPALVVLGAQPGSLTFEDKNDASQFLPFAKQPPKA